METAKKTHPMILVAAASVTAVSLAGVATLAGWFPASTAQTSASMAPLTATNITTPVATVAKADAPTTLSIPAGARITVEPKSENQVATKWAPRPAEQKSPRQAGRMTLATRGFPQRQPAAMASMLRMHRNLQHRQSAIPAAPFRAFRKPVQMQKEPALVLLPAAYWEVLPEARLAEVTGKKPWLYSVPLAAPLPATRSKSAFVQTSNIRLPFVSMTAAHAPTLKHRHHSGRAVTACVWITAG